MFLLLPVMLVGSLLEMAGLTMVVSVCAALMDSAWLGGSPAVLWLRSELHLLILLYLSRFLPNNLYDQIRRADRVLVLLCQYIRWVLLDISGKKG